MSGKDTPKLADDDSGVGHTQLGDQQGHDKRASDTQTSGVATPATVRAEDQEATPPEHRGLMAAIDRHLSKGFEKQSETLSELKLGFESVNKNLTKMHVRVQKVESKVIELDNDQTKLTQTILDTRKFVRQNIVRLTDLEKDKSATKASIDSMQQQIDDLSEKMISITDVMEQLRAGKLGTYTDLEAPTLKDQYDMKVAFMKRKHGIGFFPIYKEHLDAISATNTCSEVDAYRISVSQFLQLEMAFEEAFVVNLENHYVEIQYNKLDTVYVVFDDLDISGARRIWQESKQLRKRQTGDMDRDPRLIPMDLPQFRDRLAAMKKYASHLRWEWNRANEDKFQDGERFMTRVVEAKENGEDIYDFIVQAKPPGEDFDRVPWPANRPLPKIQWKNKEYKHHREFVMKVKRDDQVKKNFDPPGRPLVLVQTGTGRGQQRITFQPTVHTFRPEHQFIPGVVDPEARTRLSLSEAGGITPWMTEQIMNGRTDERGQQVQNSSAPDMNQQGAAAGETAGGQPDPVEPEPTKDEAKERERRQKQQDEYDRTVAELEEKERKLREEKEKKEQEAKERKERLEKQIRDRANKEKRPVEEILKEMEEEETARQAEIDRQDKEKADRLRALGGVAYSIGGKVEFQSSSMMEESGEEELDKEMQELREKTVAEELKRWEEDERNRLEREAIEEELRQNRYEIEMAKKAREDALLQQNPGKDIVTDVDNIDPNGNQDNYNVVTPQPPTGTRPKELRSTRRVKKSPKDKNQEERKDENWQEMTKEEEEDAAKAAADVTLSIPSSQMSELTFTPSSSAETILARAPLTARSMSRTSAKQPSITSFMLRRSSTLTESQIATDDESDADVFGTPTSGTLESPNRTLPLSEDTGAGSASPNLQSVSKSLQFTDENYHLVPITPAGSQTEVKVLTRKDMGKVQPSKLPLPRNQQTVEQQRRRDSLKKRWSTNSAATQPKTNKPTFSSAKPVKRAKETDSGEKDAKINRVKSPETGTQEEASDSEAKEAGVQPSLETSNEVNNSATEGTAAATLESGQNDSKAAEATEEPKEENTTASSDDLSSLSVLEVGASEVNISESDVEGDDLENTVILKETGEQSQQANNLTPLGDEPLTEEAKAGTARTVIIVNETPDVKQSPDKQPTPPPDATGHIFSVQTYSAGVTVNSDPEAGVRMAMASLIAGAPQVPTPNTEKKKAEASQID